MLTPYLHHLLLSVPIALLVSAAILMMLSWLLWPETLRKAGGVTLVLGTLTGIVAAAAGLFSHEAAGARSVDEHAIHVHRAMAYVGLGVALVTSLMWLLGLKARLSHAALFRWGVPLMTVMAAALIAWGALEPRPEISIRQNPLMKTPRVTALLGP